MHRLAVGQIGMHPQPVSRLQARHLGNGQSLGVSAHPHLDLGTHQIESSRLRQRATRQRQHNHKIAGSANLPMGERD